MDLMTQCETDQAIEEWNALAEELGLPKVQVVNKPRLRELKNRLKEAGGIEGWRYALDMIRKSSFCQGDNDRGWRANIDFMLRQSRFIKLMEGVYSDTPSKDRSVENRRRAILEAVEGMES